MQVESQRADPLPSAVASRATILMRHVSSAFDDGALFNNEFLGNLARLRCVPVNLPLPVHRLEDDGIYVSDGEERKAGRDSESGAEQAWTGGVALVRFAESAVPRDANLVFTAFPVQMEGLVPPQVRYSGGSLTAPPLRAFGRHVSRGTRRLGDPSICWRC